MTTVVFVVEVGAYEGYIDSIHATERSAMKRKREMYRKHENAGAEVSVRPFEVVGGGQ